MLSNAATVSLWTDTAQVPSFPPLDGDTSADVCVVGGGIAGLTSAYLLLKEGKSVVLVEALQPGAGETGRTTAHFMPPDERYFEVAKRFGDAGAAQMRDSFERATALVESIVETERIECDFSRLDGYLVPAAPGDSEIIDREHACTQRLGAAVTRLLRVPGLDWDTGPALCFHNQAQFHPVKYLAGLVRAIGRLGGRIYGDTRARDVEGADVITEKGRVSASAVVVATNTPFNNRFVLHTKVAPYHSYVVGLKVPRGALEPFLLWDTGDPYYYVRLDNQRAPRPFDILVVGGQDHKTGQESTPQHRWDEIEAWTRARFPQAEEVMYRWSGEVMEPADGVAYMGRNPADRGNVFVITGDSGTGMTHCTAGAMLVTDLIVGRANPWVSLYDPGRTPLRGLGEFAKEQANVAAQYTDWLQGGEVTSPDRIPPGEGALIREGLKLVAVHRAEDGKLTFLSAACPHMGCAVHWNTAEKSWDCPCHGSRFDVAGNVLHGPSNAPLGPAGPKRE
ncbi:FAD-dependent oxidoreductase [Massilia sp. METH4]|uniref:FAD-dependent oxidoreductase n=1 Tax=Massilia sp. METH4 TaxID=3123041 RepID=UPI0030CF9762